jgi:hypothetical protein
MACKCSNWIKNEIDYEYCMIGVMNPSTCMLQKDPVASLPTEDPVGRLTIKDPNIYRNIFKIEIPTNDIHVYCDCGENLELKLNGWQLNIVGIFQFKCPKCSKVITTPSNALLKE